MKSSLFFLVIAALAVTVSGSAACTVECHAGWCSATDSAPPADADDAGHAGDSVPPPDAATDSQPDVATDSATTGDAAARACVPNAPNCLSHCRPGGTVCSEDGMRCMVREGCSCESGCVAPDASVPPPDAAADSASSADAATACGPRRMRIVLSEAMQAECPGGGYQLVYWDGEGAAVWAPRGAVSDATLPATWACRGTIGFNVYCPNGGGSWRDWTPWTGQSAQAARVESIRMDDAECVTVARVYNFWPTCTRRPLNDLIGPRIPLDPEFNSRDDAAPATQPCP